jgi:hypothetical protein
VLIMATLDVYRRRIALLVFVLMGLLFVSWQSAAQSVSIETEKRIAARAGVNTTDNIGRTTGPTARETFATTGVDMSLARSGARWSHDLDGSVDYLRYDSDEFDNEVLGDLVASGTAGIVPGIFSWDFDARYGQVRSDPFLPEGPGNRERLITGSTGPDWFIPAGDRTRVQIGARASERRYQNSASLDSSQASASVGMQRAISSGSSFGLGVAARRIDYDTQLVEPFDVRNAYVSYSSQLSSRGTIAVTAGVNELKLRGETESDWLAELDWSRQLSGRSEISLSLRREFSDAGDMLRGGGLDRGVFDSSGDLALTADPFTLEAASFGYSLRHARTTFSLGVTRSSQRYLTEGAFDRDSQYSDILVSYRLRRNVSLNLTGHYREEEFRFSGATAEDLRGRLALAWGAGAKLGLSVFVERLLRSGDDLGNYDENRAGLTMVWTWLSTTAR